MTRRSCSSLCGLQNFQNPDTPSIQLASGEAVTADVIVGADGIHSLACEAVLGHPYQRVQPRHANCCYRFLIPAATLQEDPDTRWWNDDAEGLARLFPDNDTDRRIVSYTCRKYVWLSA